MKEFKCFYCNQFCLNDEEHIAHIDAEHARKLHYPTPADFEKRLNRLRQQHGGENQ